MDLITFRTVLGWCFALNFGVLLIWFLFFTLAHDFMYRMHLKLFTMQVETFDAIHYAGLAFYKILIIVFIITPYVALYFAG